LLEEQRQNRSTMALYGVTILAEIDKGDVRQVVVLKTKGEPDWD
jgi:hypothetical protein